MKRKRTVHNWFASNSNAPLVVSEPNAPPDDVVVQPAPIENIIHPTPTNDSTNPSMDVDESTIPHANESTNPPTNESTNQPPKHHILEFHPSQIFGDPADRIPIEDYAPEIRSEVRRAYLLKGRNKAEGHNFEITLDGTIRRLSPLDRRAYC